MVWRLRGTEKIYKFLPCSDCGYTAESAVVCPKMLALTLSFTRYLWYCHLRFFLKQSYNSIGQFPMSPRPLIMYTHPNQGMDRWWRHTIYYDSWNLNLFVRMGHAVESSRNHAPSSILMLSPQATLSVYKCRLLVIPDASLMENPTGRFCTYT